MTDEKWLDGYSGQTTEVLLSLEGAYRVDSIVVAFEEAILQKAQRVGMEELTVEERVVLAIEALEREVNNGGFDQFFVNSSNEFVSFIVQALRRIGCSSVAEITQGAIAALGIDGEITPQSIEAAMDDQDDERDDYLDDCDTRFFKEAGDLASHLLEFIRANSESVVL